MIEASWEYVGPGDIHDSTVDSIEEKDGGILVGLRTFDGGRIMIRFRKVREVRKNLPIGMMVYSLSKRVADSGPFLYSFTNWDDDGEAFLEIVADKFEVQP